MSSNGKNEHDEELPVIIAMIAATFREIMPVERHWLSARVFNAVGFWAR